MNKLLEGYDQRIKEFILRMEEKPIILKNNKEKYMTTRQEFYASSANKILDKKGFLFKSFKSDKERIKEVIKNKEILENYISKNKGKRKKQKQEFIKKLKQIKFEQPSMHFKKRTGLERIYDIFKKKHYLNAEQKLLYNQLVRMGIIQSNYIKIENDDDYENGQIFESGGDFNSANNIFEKNNINLNIINNDSLSDEEKYKKILHDIILNERKNMLIKRKLLLNLGNKINSLDKEAKNKLNKEGSFQRTYFKATENMAIFKKSSMNHKIFKTWSMEDLAQQQNIKAAKKTFYKTKFPKFSKNQKIICLKKGQKNLMINNEKNFKINNIESNLENLKMKMNNFNLTDNHKSNFSKFDGNKSENIFNLIEDEKSFNNVELKKEIIHVNPLLYKINYRKFKKEFDINNKNSNNINTFSFDKLKILKEIAFENNEQENTESVIKERTDSYYDDYNKDENIVKMDIDKIAENVLKKCNWNHKKINYKNSDGKGKLMFTNGLTVKEFVIKYGILP